MPIRAVAILASLAVAFSFIAFAADRSREGSEGQVRQVDGGLAAGKTSEELDVPAPSPLVERRREAAHGSLRELVDDANDIVVTPFAGVVDSSSVWVERLATTALALLAFGLGGLFLANAMPARTRKQGDWREATS